MDCNLLKVMVHTKTKIRINIFHNMQRVTAYAKLRKHLKVECSSGIKNTYLI